MTNLDLQPGHLLAVSDAGALDMVREHPGAVAMIATIQQIEGWTAPAAQYWESERANLLEIAIDQANRINSLEAENAALKAALDLARVGFGDPTPADLPDPPRRPDGTLLPQPKPWSAPKPGAADSRRVGS